MKSYFSPLPLDSLIGLKKETLAALGIDRVAVVRTAREVAQELLLPANDDLKKSYRGRLAAVLLDISFCKEDVAELGANASLEQIAGLGQVFDDYTNERLLEEDVNDERFAATIARPLKDFQSDDILILRDMIGMGRLDAIQLIGVMTVYRATKEFRILSNDHDIKPTSFSLFQKSGTFPPRKRPKPDLRLVT